MEHAAVMRALLETRERRTLKRQVARLSVAEVIAELEERRCNTHGQEEAVRDRLLRALMKEAEPNNVHIPWYDWDIYDPSQAEQADAAQPPEPINVQPRRRRVPRNDAPRMQEFSSSDESERERRPPIQVTVDVHRPATVSPVSAPTSTTTAITMSQAGRANLATVTAGSRRLSTITTSMMSGRPTMHMAPELLNGWNQQQWEYQYEQLVRSRAPQPTQHERRERATPAQPARVQERWSTPAENFDEIRRRESSDAESVASRSLSQHERVAYEKIRVTLGTRNNEHITPRNPNQHRQGNSLRPRSLHELENVLNRSREYVRDEQDQEIKGERRSAEEFAHARRNHSRERREQETRKRSMREERSPVIPRQSDRESVRSFRSSRGSRDDLRNYDADYESDISSRRRRGADENSRYSRDVSPRRRGNTAPAAKILRDWNIKFNGDEGKEDPEVFLEKLEDCRDDMNVSDRELLSALPSVLGREADVWYRTVKSRVRTWSQFKREFRHQYIIEYDREDLLDDLRKRTQAKGEKVAKFLTSFRYIVSRFDEPPTRRSQVETAYRNLLPEYRRAMADKIVESLEDIENYGRMWERQKDLDSRYAPPPPAEKMRVKSAAYRSSPSESKKTVAAVATAVKSHKSEEKPAERRNENIEVHEDNNEKISTAKKEYEKIEAKEEKLMGHVCAFTEVRIRDNQKFVRERREFTGTCYSCHQPGHRALDCPESVCFGCQRSGHFVRNCPQRAASRNCPSISQESCQMCDHPGCTVKTCPTCAPLWRRIQEEDRKRNLQQWWR